MAAQREGASANEDLSSRCLSLLDEVKDHLEAHKSGQSGENSASDREAHPSSLLEDLPKSCIVCCRSELTDDYKLRKLQLRYTKMKLNDFAKRGKGGRPCGL